MSTIELLRVIDDEHRRQARAAELARVARTARIHHRSLAERLGRWLQGGRAA